MTFHILYQPIFQLSMHAHVFISLWYAQYVVILTSLLYFVNAQSTSCVTSVKYWIGYCTVAISCNGDYIPWYFRNMKPCLDVRKAIVTWWRCAWPCMSTHKESKQQNSNNIKIVQCESINSFITHCQKLWYNDWFLPNTWLSTTIWNHCTVHIIVVSNIMHAFL